MNKKLSLLVVSIVLMIAAAGYAAGQVGIGTSTPDPSAALDIQSTTQGVLLPRVTTAQRDAINGGTFAEGLTLYNTEDDCIQVWDGTSWKCIVGLTNTGGGSGSNGGAIPETTSSAFPLLSVAAAPPIIMEAPGTGAALWIDDNTIVRYTNNGSPSLIELGVYDDGLRELASYNYSVSSYNLLAASVDQNDNLIFWGMQGSIGSYVVVNPSDGATVLGQTALNSQITNQIGFAYHTVMDNGDVVFFTDYNLGRTSALNIATFAPDYSASISSRTFANPLGGWLGDYQSGSTAPTSFGFILVGKGHTDTKLTYSAYDFAGTQIKSAAPLITDTNSPMYGVTSYSILRDNDFLYVSTYDAGAGGISGVAKLEIDGSGNITQLWETQLPYPAAGGGNSSVNRPQSMVMELDNTNQLMVNGQLFDNTPTGFYHDGTLNRGGFSWPTMVLDTTNGSVIKVVTYDSPAVLTNFGTGDVTTTIINNGNNAFSYLYSPSKHRVVRMNNVFGTLHAGGNFGWSFQADILDQTTLESIYALSNDGVSQTVGKRFMVYDFNENINRVEIVVTDGFVGDLLDIDSDLALPSGMSKSYNILERKMTVTGTAVNMADDFTTVLNGLTFATTAGTGSRTLEAKIFDDDGNENTTTFSIEVAD
ncbi:MAG: hypothetical protein AAF702_16315 [Chloroflexota bacterium]